MEGKYEARERKAMAYYRVSWIEEFGFGTVLPFRDQGVA
jgi:hypothetical protein